MTLSLPEIVAKENRDDTLFIFYADLLDGCKDVNESKVVQLLRDDFKFELLLRNFSLSKQLKVRNVRNELDRDVKVINMLILKYVLRCYEEIKVQSHEWEESRNEYGKPRLEHRSYQYNISDEVGIVCLAIGFNERLRGSEIGIDLANPEDIQRFGLSDLQNFYKVDFRSIFGPNEIEELDRLFDDLTYDEQLQRLTQMWALKESYCKYLGVGIAAGMENFEFPEPKKFLLIEKDVEGGQDLFEVVARNIEMNKTVNFDVNNGCFQLPQSKLICSVFGDYRKACLVKLDVRNIIKEFTQSGG